MKFSECFVCRNQVVLGDGGVVGIAISIPRNRRNGVANNNN